MNEETIQAPIKSAVLLDWASAFEAGPRVVGGKAWNLGRLHRYGFNVPHGGVIPVEIYRQFIVDNSLTLKIIQASKSITLDNLNQRDNESLLTSIQDEIQKGHFSKNATQEITQVLKEKKLLDVALAIRSSATSEDSAEASFAGIHESYLNVNGIEKIISTIKMCFASVWSKRAVAYRRKMNISDENVLPAVIVMALVEADAAGVAFSCDPASGREDICLVNANYGLGESVVDGTVEPDTYLIDRYSFKTTSSHIGKKLFFTSLNKSGGTLNRKRAEHEADSIINPVLSCAQQKTLGLLISRIYAALSASEIHQDIEWAIKDGVFYVLQARPVTVMPRYTDEALSDQPDIWSNSNFRDALPMVLHAAQRDANVSLVNYTILSSFSEFGLPIKAGLSVVKLINGRLYFNTGLYQRLLYHAVGMKPEDFNLFSGGHQPNIDVPAGSPFAGLRGVAKLFRVIGYARKISQAQKKQFVLYEEIMRFVDQFNKTNLRLLSDEKLLALFHQTDQTLISFMREYMLLSAGIGPFGMAIKSLKKNFGDEAIGVVSALAIGQGNQPSANQVYGLLRLAEIARDDPTASAFFKAAIFSKDALQSLPDSSPFKQAFTEYLNEYGYRAVFEVDISYPRWNEDPSYLLANIANSLQTANVALHKEGQRKKFAKAVVRLKKEVSFVKRFWVKSLVKDAIKGADTRETAKSYSVRLFGLNRFLYLEFGRRLSERGLIAGVNDVFHCSRADILSFFQSDWNGGKLQSLINDRKSEMTFLKNSSVADVVIKNKAIYEMAKLIDGGNAYQGIGVSAGQVEGLAKRIKDPNEGLTLGQGDILVAPSTDPSWTPLFLNIAGIVLETGGYTSHGSIVAREYGIPAVVNVAGALTIIDENQRLVVDGDNGRVVLK